MTAIPYLTRLWSPVEGCTPVSAGCDNCWARAYLHRWGRPTVPVVKRHKIDDPVRWRKPQTIGVGFTGDLFHKEVDDMFIRAVLLQALSAPRHRFIFLTKRPERMDRIMFNLDSVARADNVWLGVSVEDQATADARIPILLDTECRHRWVSLEPQLGPVDLSGYLPTFGRVAHEPFGRGDWVVQGCESGPKRRPFDTDWARVVRDQCAAAEVPYYLKQMPTPGCQKHDDDCPFGPCDETCEERRPQFTKSPMLDGCRHLELPWRAP